MGINKAMTSGIFTMNSKHTHSENKQQMFFYQAKQASNLLQSIIDISLLTLTVPVTTIDAL